LAGRYDKYDPVSGGFRAAIAADKSTTDIATPIGVGLDTNGRVVAGAGNTGIVGVLMITKAVKAGDIVDVMTDGELVEMGSLAAGTKYTANTTTGVISNGAGSATQTPVGWTVEATRLVVRIGGFTWQTS
jgi:hypothetical protein